MASEYINDNLDKFPSYHQSYERAKGLNLNQLLDHHAQHNTAFQQHQWEDAKNNPCLPQPCTQTNPFPQWSPPPGKGFIYPSDSRGQDLTLLGQDPTYENGTENAYQSPYQPVKKPSDTVDYDLSPEGILNMGSQAHPQAINKNDRLGGFSYEELQNLEKMHHQLPMEPHDSAVRHFSPLVSTNHMLTTPPDYTHANHVTEYFDEKQDTNQTPNQADQFLFNTFQAWKGALYDLQNWDQLPTENKARWTFCRDDRWKFLLFTLFLLPLFYLVAWQGTHDKNMSMVIALFVMVLLVLFLQARYAE